MKRVAALGLDLGRKRIGVAGCDGLGLLSRGLTTIHRTSWQQTVAELKSIAIEREATILIVGLPYSLDGTIGPQAKEVQKLARKLSQALELPIEYVDERLTSVEAIEQLKAQKRFSSRNKGLIDQQAAAIVLQQWLDSNSHLQNSPRETNEN